MPDKPLKKKFIDELVSLFKKKFKTVIILIVILIGFFVSFLFHKNTQSKNNLKIAQEYTHATILIKQKKIKESELLLKSIIDKDHKFYSPLALYLMIDNKVESDDKKIIIYFDNILKNKKIEKENLNLIKIKKAIYLIKLDQQEAIIETLNAIINSESVWRSLAINLISEYFLSKNQKVKSEKYIQLLNNKIKK
tara:strand:- start:527 stop:1108 length:582 start_codon:yes stop_codon:yes gene_type:complete